MERQRPASAANRKPPFWSSKVHGIPQTYAGSSRPAGEPLRLKDAAATARPKTANQTAIERRNRALQVKDTAATQVSSEVLTQIENKLRKAVVLCTPEYEKEQTILLRAFQTFDQAGRGTIPLDAFQKALACFQIETSDAECRALLATADAVAPSALTAETLAPSLTRASAAA